jgi:hypothetical protein
MNERIRELIKAAGLTIPADTEYNSHIYRDALEKFTASIINECAGVARQHILERHGMSTDYTGRVLVEDAILDHFKEKQ